MEKEIYRFFRDEWLYNLEMIAETTFLINGHRIYNIVLILDERR